jgi:hypothetical protein
MAHVGSESLETMVQRVVTAIDVYTPSVLSNTFSEENGPQVLALAALHRMGDLLEGELILSKNGRDSATRLLGRTLTELWLNLNELLLDPNAALGRLFAEDASVQSQVQHGLGVMWDRYEKYLDGSSDLRDPNFQRAAGQKSNVEALSIRVAQLRKERGFGGGGLAEYNYQMTFRRDSINDVHVTLYQLFRHIRTTPDGIEILRQPGREDNNGLRGPEAILNDAQLTSDAIGIYLLATGQKLRLKDLKDFLAWPPH